MTEAHFRIKPPDIKPPEHEAAPEPVPDAPVPVPVSGANEPRRIFLPAAFLLVIFALGFGTFVLKFDVFAGEVAYVQENYQVPFFERAEALIGRWEAAAASELVLQEALVELDGLGQRVLGRSFVRDADYSYSVIRDNHGWLQFITFPAQPRAIVQDIEAYKELGVPMIYVQPPTKFIEGYTEFPPTLHDQTAANVAQNLHLLDEAGVAYLDLRAAAEEDGLDKETIFYRTDHHWRVETAFWAAARTVAEAEQLFGAELDPDGYYTDPVNWRQTVWQNCFLGSQGRRVGRFYGGLDDFTLLTPAFASSFIVEITGQDGSSQSERGSFDEVLLDWEMLTDPSVYSNRYGAYWGADYPLVSADNLQNDSGFEVLIVKDSYALPYGAFLATMVDKLYMVDPRYYDLAKLPDYIAELQPDLLLIMYS